MAARDLLRKKAQSPLGETYLAAGAFCELWTNFEPILEAARASFIRVKDAQPCADFRMRFWVDPELPSYPPWPKPRIRGVDHLVFAGFDSASSLLIDLRGRRAIGRFSPAFGADRGYWMRVVFPVLLTIFGASVGTVTVHCGCVEKDGKGLLLVGRSGSGKSTLSVALAQSGFALLSDDWTYFSSRDGLLLAWGLPTALKLCAEAASYFPELAGQEPGITMNGERGFEVDPEERFRVHRSRCCEPQWVIFLERHASHELSLTKIPSAEAATRLGEGLLAEAPEAMRRQVETVQKLVERPCWLLQYGGAPQAVARALANFCGRAGLQPDILPGRADLP